MRNIVLVFLAGVLTIGTALYRWAGLHRESPPADLTVIWGDEPESLNPHVISGVLEARYIDALYEGLTTYDPATLDPVPGVAERWEISPDGLRYRFHLRADARWSNGDPVTAHDFVWSWRRLMDPRTTGPYAYILYPIRNAQKINETKPDQLTDDLVATLGVAAADDRTLDVDLESPTAYFLELCGFMTAAPVHRPTVERYGRQWAQPGRLVGNGPFVLEEWTHHHRVVMAKNPLYWDHDHVSLRRVITLPVSSDVTAFNFYISGACDWIQDPNIPASVMDEARRRPDYVSFGALGTYYFRFNLTRPPFGVPPPGRPGAPSDADRPAALAKARKTRLAFTLAADRTGICERITKAGQTPAFRMVPPGMRVGSVPYDEPDAFGPPKGYPRDVERAARIFREAWPDPKEFPDNASLMCRDTGTDIAEVLQDNWLKVLGVKIRLKKQDWNAYLESLDHLDYDMAWSGWWGDYNDPNTFLDMWLTGGGNNDTGFSDPRYDELIRLAAREIDPAKRRAFFHEAETILIDREIVICPVYQPVSYNLMNPRIRGMHPNLRAIYPIKHLGMAPKGAAR